MRNDETAAIAAASGLIQEPIEDEAETVVEQETEDVAPQETEEEVLFPEWEIQLPEDLEDELSSPTLEEVQQELQDDQEYQELDEDGRRLLARARQAEREAEFYRSQRAASERTKWIEEAKKYMPLSEPFLEGIKSDSRRGFLREAKRYHEAVLPMVKPITDQAKLAVEKVKEEERAKARAEAEKAWGKPPKSDDQPTEAVITQDDLDRNRSKGDLASTVRAMIFPNKES